MPTALFALKSKKIKAKTKFEKSSMNAKSLLMLCNQYLRGQLQEIIGIKNLKATQLMPYWPRKMNLKAATLPHLPLTFPLNWIWISITLVFCFLYWIQIYYSSKVKLIEPVGEAFQREELKSSLCSKVKSSWIVFLVTWCEDCGRKKKKKSEVIRRKAIRPFGV